MNKKIKILLIGLAVVCALALVIAFQLNAVNKSLRKQFVFKEQAFHREKQSLGKQLSSISETKKRLEVEFSDLQAKFESLINEKDSLQGKFDLVAKERGVLVDKVQDLVRQKEGVEAALKKAEEKLAQGQTTTAVAAIPTSAGAKTFDDAYWASILKEKARLNIEVKNLRKQLSEVRLKAERAVNEGQKLELQFKTIRETKSDLERRLTYNERLSETLSEDLVREKRDKKAIAEQVERLREENFSLKSRLMAMGDRKSSLETKLADIQQEREILAKRLAELDQILQQRVDQIIKVKDDLKSARTQAREASIKDSRVVQLKPIVVKAQEGVLGKQGSIAGQVLAINSENNFIIVDVGEDDGVRVGQIFTIYRNQKKVATIEVIQTRKEISAADIKSLTPGSRITIGDMVS